jgi:hypothetical protein
MTTRLLSATLAFFCFLSLTQLNAQSLYMNNSSYGVQSGMGFNSSSGNVSGTDFSMGYSFNRNFDISVNYSKYNNPNLRTFSSDVSYSSVGADVIFYPKKQWDDDLLTFQIIAGTSHSTSPRADGYTFTLGTAVSRTENLTDKVSFIPRAGFYFIPFTPGPVTQFSMASIDGSFTVEVVKGVKLLMSPAMNYDITRKETRFAIMGGFVL